MTSVTAPPATYSAEIVHLAPYWDDDQGTYHHWEEAGPPDDSPLTFWPMAEREWICNQYVPNRHDGLSTHG
ncbi:MAG: DUF2934 domain-containing protein [Planctomycetes bacterium]|nr:DUF2934 domain-containing protein [Planctomycetota bacterium]